MNAAKRIQLNLKLDRSTLFPEMENLRDSTMLPIYYAEQSGAVTASLANKFKNTVFTVRYGVLGSVWAIVGVAGQDTRYDATWRNPGNSLLSHDLCLFVCWCLCVQVY